MNKVKTTLLALLIFVFNFCTTNRFVIDETRKRDIKNVIDINSFYELYKTEKKSTLVVFYREFREDRNTPHKIKIKRKNKIVYSSFQWYGYKGLFTYDRFVGKSLNFYEKFCGDTIYHSMTNIDTCKHIFITLVRPKKKKEHLTYYKKEIWLETVWPIRDRPSY
jgi:hypothetical protein